MLTPEQKALLQRHLSIDGDGNVVGNDNTVRVTKQTAGDYAVQIGEQSITATVEELRRVLTVSKTHLYYTSEESGNPFITFPKDARAIQRTIATFDGIVHRIEAQDFAIPERPVKLCRECDMRHYCDVKNWRFCRTEHS